MKQQITEEQNLQDQWYQDAKKQTMQTLPEFLRHLTEDYDHDYGTICHAMAAGSIATAWAIDKSPQGGITGFQGGAVMWEFIRQWNYKSNKLGLKIVDYDKILYPQYANVFDNTIGKEHWTRIQEQAKASIENSPTAHPDVVAHWQSIVDGKLPFGFTISNED